MPEYFGPTPRRGVACGDGRDGQRPLDGQVGIAVDNRYVLDGVVRPVDPVANVRGRRERLKPVQEAGRNIEVPKVVVVEAKGFCLPKGGRVSPNVHQDIVDRSARAPHQLRLATSRASVHTPDHAFGRAGLGILNERRRSARLADVLIEDRGIERSGEKAPLVTEGLRNENEHSCKRCRFDAHGEMVS